MTTNNKKTSIYKKAYKYKANKQRKYFIIFIWIQQGLTLVLRISIYDRKSGYT